MQDRGGIYQVSVCPCSYSFFSILSGRGRNNPLKYVILDSPQRALSFLSFMLIPPLTHHNPLSFSLQDRAVEDEDSPFPEFRASISNTEVRVLFSSFLSDYHQRYRKHPL